MLGFARGGPVADAGDAKCVTSGRWRRTAAPHSAWARTPASSRWSARRAERSPGSRAFNALVRAKDAQIESLPREMDDVRAEVSRIAAPAQAQASR
jgi:hypothetical protein